MARRRMVEATVDADGEFATLLAVDPEAPHDLSISGTFTGTVSLQRKFDDTNWRTVATWTAPIETQYLAGAGCDLRLGFFTAGYGSGSAVVRIEVG